MTKDENDRLGAEAQISLNELTRTLKNLGSPVDDQGQLIGRPKECISKIWEALIEYRAATDRLVEVEKCITDFFQWEGRDEQQDPE